MGFRSIRSVCVAELLGTTLFAAIGGAASAGAMGNGVALAALVAITWRSSGGKLNPIVSLAVALATGPVTAAKVRVLNPKGGINPNSPMPSLNPKP